MSYYLSIIDNHIVCEDKGPGRPRKGYKQVSQDMWAKDHLSVVISTKQYCVDDVLKWLNASSIQRSTDSMSLFLCHTSPNCPINELLGDCYACRINIDLTGKSLLVWWLQYIPNMPDLIIYNILRENE